MVTQYRCIPYPCSSSHHKTFHRHRSNVCSFNITECTTPDPPQTCTYGLRATGSEFKCLLALATAAHTSNGSVPNLKRVNPPPLMLLGRVGAGEGGGKRDALKTHTGWKMRNDSKDKSISMIYYSEFRKLVPCNRQVKPEIFDKKANILFTINCTRLLSHFSS